MALRVSQKTVILSELQSLCSYLQNFVLCTRSGSLIVAKLCRSPTVSRKRSGFLFYSATLCTLIFTEIYLVNTCTFITSPFRRLQNQYHPKSELERQRPIHKN